MSPPLRHCRIDDDDDRIIVRFDIGMKKASAVDALINGGLDRTRTENSP